MLHAPAHGDDVRENLAARTLATLQIDYAHGYKQVPGDDRII